MKSIWKKQLHHTDGCIEVTMPKESRILSVQNQNEEVCIWYLVDTENENEKRYFEIFGTGHNIPVGMGIDREYIGTFQLRNGSLVFHLFERLN